MDTNTRQAGWADGELDCDTNLATGTPEASDTIPLVGPVLGTISRRKPQRTRGTMGGKTSKVTAQDKAILDMKSQRDKLHQYQRRIGVLTTKETEIARRLLDRGDRQGALVALRRKKYQETLLSRTDAQLEQLEKLTASVEFAQIQKDVVFGLQLGTKVLEQIHTEMGGLEHVQKLMGETADAIAYQKEVSDMLGGRISSQDEEEVEDELEALQAEMTGDSRKLPSVPMTRLPDGTMRESGRQRRASEQMETRAMLAS